eukprot:gene6850-9379_t
MPVNRKFDLVDVFLSANSLSNMETFSTTDAFAVLFQVDHNNNELKLIKTTDVVKNSLNPEWATAVTLEYVFESVQEYIIRVFHHQAGNSTSDLLHNTLIGECSFLMSSLMTTRSQIIKQPLISKTSNAEVGEFLVRGELHTNTNHVFVANFYGSQLTNKDGFFGKSDPFLTISRLNEDGSWTAVWRNERIENNLNPHWPEAKILMSTLCNGDLERPLKIEVFDYDSNGKHDSMGIVETSVGAMIGYRHAPMNIIEADKKEKKSSYVNSGTITANNAYIEPHPTFSDFIAGGCEISVVVAIDFTGSNGDPIATDSLHYINPIATGVKSGFSSGLNEYQQTIVAVGNILEPYDSDKKYNVLGFGAKIILPDGDITPVQHGFLLNDDGPVNGINGILEVYRSKLNNLMLSGPTLFSPIIHSTLDIVKSQGCSQDYQKYTILLILTDGIINDLDQTKAAVVDASEAPMSIVVVGVGAEDFSSMKALDSDKKQLQDSSGDTAQRDILQFVSFREQQKNGAASIAADVLAEIPGQLLKYMELNGIKPNPKN